MAKTHVIQAQTALASAGFYAGNIDGDFGGGSLGAVLSMIDNTGKAVDILSKPDCSTTKPKLSRDDITQSAKTLTVEPATLKAVIDVECPKAGFGEDGKPTILFEPHIYYRYLTKANIITKRDQLQTLFPDMVSEHWDKSLYNVRPQHDKLSVAAVLDWDAAHMACSWGKAQVMGFNWESLGYPSLKAFIDAMYESEAKQLDAMVRYIKVNNLADELQRHDWAGFARGYNGSAYAKNQYDVKLAAAYAKAKKEGW